VEKGKPESPDPGEPGAVAEAARRLGLGFVVVTSVTRDDLPDGGASAFAAVIGEIRRRNPGTLVEVLVPDFDGSGEALETVIRAAPEVLNHNVETVPRLYRKVRPGAVYRRSLELLRRAAGAPGVVTKSGMMLGLGEERAEVLGVIGALADAGCRALTLGQYLQPTRRSLPVARYLAPGEFEELAGAARELGIGQVAAGPLVRSSYRAGEMYRNCVPAGLPEEDSRNRVERG
jgi:lipoic acid synthetase